MFCNRNPTPRVPAKVRHWRACRGLRAWHAKNRPFGTEETLQEGTDVGEGGDSSTRLAEETSTVRMTEQRWPTYLRAIRARVERKSPVREYCTPGSVRGALGNQRPYLDKVLDHFG